MASKGNKYFGSSPGSPNLRDFQHASRLFVDGDQRLAPKVKYLYHVVFAINSSALPNLNFKFQHSNEINMLVKTADLPRFQVQTETLNQYNRKRNVPVKIDYQPVTIKFHDDNHGVTRQLWENYYSYYYADPETAKKQGTYNKWPITPTSPYGLDNASYTPFFDYITIYQMSKRKWNSYKLINPVIQQWNHDNLDHSQSQIMEQTMTILYESVVYANGAVSSGNPPGFAVEHYDRSPSPIALAGGGASSGGGVSVGGVLQGISDVFGAIGSGAAFSVPGAIATAITAVNTYQNAKALGSAKAKAGLIGLATTGLVAAAKYGVSGVKNTGFPVKENNQEVKGRPRGGA